MAKPTFIAVFFTLALGSSLAHAQHTVDDDGFKQPLQHLQFNPGLDQREFERSTLNALNVYDPLESWNRRVYHFNYRFDEWVFLPIVDGYRYITPNLVQTGVSNFFSNLGDVPNLLNSALQLKGKRAMQTTGPYLILPLLGPSNLRDTGGLVADFAAKSQVNWLNVAEASVSHPEITLLEVVDQRSTVNFRYGQLNSPFEYEKIRFFYHEARKLQIAE